MASARCASFVPSLARKVGREVLAAVAEEDVQDVPRRIDRLVVGDGHHPLLLLAHGARLRLADLARLPGPVELAARNQALHLRVGALYRLFAADGLVVAGMSEERRREREGECSEQKSNDF